MKQNAIVCDASTPLMQKAVAALTEILLDYTLEYPVCFAEKPCGKEDAFRFFHIGTKENNPTVAAMDLPIPSQAEGYCIRVWDDTVVIAGSDEHGVLYGCMDFYHQYVTKFEFPNTDRYCINIFEDALPDFEIASFPSVKNRGLWTWGHVIYDYRGYIDNMVKLKMNALVIWNDFVPVNAKDMVAYAHECGIKIIWGYAWGWDTDCAQFSEADTKKLSRDIFRKYEEEYAPLGGDGIYFQSYTELNVQELNGRIIADSVTEFVNDTAALFFEKYPDLELQFGLHATSVNENLQFIKNVNPKIRIVWEDCGAFPFAYLPSDVQNFNETADFAKQLAVLRGKDDKFGAVTKGFTKLDWYAFRHPQGPMHIGVSSDFVKQNRKERKQKTWKYLQAYWLTNADKALETVRVLSECKNRDLWITPLVEDGMFEEEIMYPVALFAEMLWDCNKPLPQIMRETALRSYVKFA